MQCAEWAYSLVPAFLIIGKNYKSNADSLVSLLLLTLRMLILNLMRLNLAKLLQAGQKREQMLIFNV